MHLLIAALAHGTRTFGTNEAAYMVVIVDSYIYMIKHSM